MNKIISSLIFGLFVGLTQINSMEEDNAPFINRLALYFNTVGERTVFLNIVNIPAGLHNQTLTSIMKANQEHHIVRWDVNPPAQMDAILEDFTAQFKNFAENNVVVPLPVGIEQSLVAPGLPAIGANNNNAKGDEF